ncbi:MAG: hypothetical protein AAB442_02940, partial [Patescibacteria group bacterium]
TITESNNGNNCGPWTSVTISAAASIPTLSNPTATSITSSGATLGATVSSNGGASLTARGTCWSTSLTNPSLTNGASCLAEGGTAVSIFSHARTGMPAGTTIYYTGYATNSVGTGYTASSISFVTSAAPFIDLAPAGTGAVTPTTATVGSATSFAMQIINNGNTTTGVAFTNRLRRATDSGGTGSTNVNTNTAGPLAAGAQTSGFSISYTPVAGDVGTRWFSICADEDMSGNGTITESNNGNNCGPWTSVTVNPGAATAPVIDTPTSESITPTSAVLGATVQSDGGSPITGRGVCWSTAIDPSLSNGATCQSTSGTTGVFTVPASGLTPGTTYYFRGYATNSVDTSYTLSGISFTTLGPVANLTVDNPVANVGDTRNLTVNCTDAASYSGTAPIGNGVWSGTPVVVSTGALNSPGAQPYQLICYSGAGQTGTASAPDIETITVNNPNISITAEPTRVAVGGNTLIRWSATSVTSCSIRKNGALTSWQPTVSSNATNGQRNDTINGQSTFVLSCSPVGGGAAITSTVIVNVEGGFKPF